MQTKFFGTFAWVFIIVGIIYFLIGIGFVDAALLSLAVACWINAYAWSLVQTLSDEVDELQTKIQT